MHESWKSAFDSVHAEPELKEHTKEYLGRTLYRSRRNRKVPAVRLAAASFLCLFFCIAGAFWIFFTPVAYISVDINPSMELGVNRFSRVISVESYNEDGSTLAGNLNLRFMNYTDALNRILENDTISDLLSGDGVLSLTVAGESEARSSQMLQEVQTTVSGYTNVLCHSGSMDEMHEAHSCGMSFGKYQAFLILRDLDPSITEEEVQNMTMKEIQDQIRLYSGGENSGSSGGSQGTGTDSKEDSCETSGQGSGRHNQDSCSSPEETAAGSGAGRNGSASGQSGQNGSGSAENGQNSSDSGHHGQNGQHHE